VRQAETNLLGAQLDGEHSFAKGWFNTNAVPLASQIGSLVACYVSARQAEDVDPPGALRHE
jgi:hypothetical protein